MAALTRSSGTTAFAPSLAEMTLDAFARVQIRPPSLTADHWFQARLSANLLFSEWSNVGMPLLWKIEKIEVPLLPGVSEYTLPDNIVAPLDAYIRQYTLGTAVDFAPSFATTAGDTLVLVTQADHGYKAGDMVFYNTACSVGGQVIQGAYLVVDVADSDTYRIEVPTPMDGTSSETLPVFATTSGSTTVSVTLANHNLAVGDSFYCNTAVTVGGLTLSGQLVVTGVTGTDTFQVTSGSAASSTANATQNSGQMQAAGQSPGVDPTDFIVTQISRTSYASQPAKGPNTQTRPTTFWFQRRRTPLVDLWTAPDNNAPYVFNLWAMIQPDDAVIDGGQGVDVPYRFLEAYASGLAAKLARKYPPPPESGVTVQDLREEASVALAAALGEDIERVPLYISGQMASYWR